MASFYTYCSSSQICLFTPLFLVKYFHFSSLKFLLLLTLAIELFFLQYSYRYTQHKHTSKMAIDGFLEKKILKSPPSFLKRLWILKHALIPKTRVRDWLCLRKDKNHPYHIFLNEKLSTSQLFSKFIHKLFIVYRWLLS